MQVIRKKFAIIEGKFLFYKEKNYGSKGKATRFC